MLTAFNPKNVLSGSDVGFLQDSGWYKTKEATYMGMKPSGKKGCVSGIDKIPVKRNITLPFFDLK